MTKGLGRRSIAIAICASIIIIFTLFTSFSSTSTKPDSPLIFQSSTSKESTLNVQVVKGHVIAPKLANETAKAELGRAAWKVLHTTFARFPKEPTKDERTTLESFVYLFQRLYPCGECATHFGELLKKFPPQVSSRNTAAGWGCHIHNEVNKSLGKPLFDCTNIGDFYDCGCGDDDEEEEEEEEEQTDQYSKNMKATKSFNEKQRNQQQAEDDTDTSLLKLEREDYQRGG